MGVGVMIVDDGDDVEQRNRERFEGCGIDVAEHYWMKIMGEYILTEETEAESI